MNSIPDINHSPFNQALPTLNTQANWVPAGFWIRFLASIVDGIILSIPSYFINLFIITPLWFVYSQMSSTFASTSINLATIALFFIAITIRIFYYGWFYAHKGATPGKLLFKLKVVNLETGNKLSYGSTILREILGKFLCGLTLTFGFIMAGFRPDKRGLHDLVANTQVLQER